MDPRLTLISTWYDPNGSKIEIWLVDGDRVRASLDPNFTNFGHHYTFDFIPVGQWWLDREHSPDETSFYLTHLSVEYSAMQSGVDRITALAQADKAERSERSKSDKYRSNTDTITDTSKVKKQLLAKFDSVIVWLVDGELVRDFYDTDFTEGGHGLIYDWIPSDEIWIDDDLEPSERSYTLAHEMTERSLMKQSNMSYDDAHKCALNIESLLRRVIAGEQIESIVGELTTQASLGTLMPMPMKSTDGTAEYPLVKRTRKDDHKDGIKESVSDHSTSIMVALEVPLSVVHKLEMSGIYDTDDSNTTEDPLHVTLVYLGKDQRDKLDACIHSVTRCVNQSANVMTASITGFAKFKEGDDGVPVVALVSCKGLEHLKVDLELALTEAGIEIPSEYGFIPHMTIRYDKDDSVELPVLETEVSWIVDHVTIFADNNATRIPVPFKKVASQESIAAVSPLMNDVDSHSSGSHSDYHSSPWQLGPGHAKPGFYRSTKSATQASDGSDSRDTPYGGENPDQWPIQWTKGMKKLNIAYNKQQEMGPFTHDYTQRSESTQFSDETAWDAIINHNSLDIVNESNFKSFCVYNRVNLDDLTQLEQSYALWSVLDQLDEATQWVVTGYRDIDSAVKATLKASSKGSYNWHVLQKTTEYALLESGFGYKKEFKLIHPGDSSVTYTTHQITAGARAQVFTRTLTK